MPSPPPEILWLGPLRVDLTLGEVRRGETTSRLTTTERSLLRTLWRAEGPVSRERLHQEVWGHGLHVISRAADTTVRRLRKKLGEDSRAPRHLLTVHGLGYELVGAEAAPATEPQAEERPEWLAPILSLDATSPRGLRPEWLERRDALREQVLACLEARDADAAAKLATVWLGVQRRLSPDPDHASICDRILAMGPALDPAVRLELALATLKGPDCGARVERARAAAERGSPSLQIRALLTRAPGEDPLPLAERAVALARAGVPDNVAAHALGTLATLLHSRAPERSQTLFFEALELAQRSGARWEEAIVSGNFAGLLRELGALDAAEKRYRATITALAELGDPWSEGIARMSLATLLHQRGKLEQARAQYLHCQAKDPTGDPVLLARLQVNLDALELDLGGTPDPLEMDRTLGTLRRHREEVYEALCLHNQGQAWIRQGQSGLGRTALERALSLGERVSRESHVAEFRASLAQLDWKEGHRARALQGLDAAIQGLSQAPTRQRIRDELVALRERWATEAQA